MADTTARNGLDEPVGFDEPWEATVFALAVSLNERNLISWNDWTQLVVRLRAEGAGSNAGESTYFAWLAALEALVVSTGITDEQALADKKAAWDAAARNTPHGAPVVLPPERRSAPTTDRPWV